jgi:N-6 DNA Methylase
MSTVSFEQVLTATGYFTDGQPAPGLHLGEDAQSLRRGRGFSPDALWRSPSALTVYFKFELTTPTDQLVSEWRREIWNEGFAPLLWVISPARIDLYNGFGTPTKEDDAQRHLIRTFENIDSSLRELDALAGRLSIETGQFWLKATTVDRKTSVSQKLLSDLDFLEHDLVGSNLDRGAAQALIGRVIFIQYLIDREIVTATRLKKLCGYAALPPILRDRVATGALFAWLSRTFNGDMFPPSSATSTPQGSHLARVADFLEAIDPQDGQRSFFPYQFDVIPVELISSIYEQFAHAVASPIAPRSTEAVRNGVHYTRLSVVSLVLDETMEKLTGMESVLDLTCGSAVFLVEAFRRLVSLRAGGEAPTRDLIRSTLYEQVYGVDISEAAIRVAAFSLYLAALELDPDPQPPHSLKFQPLIGKTLLIGDAHTVEQTADGKAALTTETGLKRFDLIVGNPPWSFKGRSGTEARRKTRVAGIPAQPRGEGLDFVLRAVDFSHEKTRFGVILSALPFFSRSGTGIATAQHVLQLLAPVILVNLSNLSGWLFATATMPAVVLFARHRPQRSGQVTIVQIPWSPSGAKTHTFEVSPSDILELSLTDIEKMPIKLKAAAVGRRRDLALLDSVTSSYTTLGDHFAALDTELHVGLIRGLPANQTRDARELKGLDLLEADHIQRFYIPNDLPKFELSKAQWPRSREIYRAPILIIKETLSEGPRAIVAVADRDLVFTNAYFGTSLPIINSQSAHLLAAILSSSLACWFFIMTGSEFGIWKRRLLRHDVALLPTPDLKQALKLEAGKRLLQIEKKLRNHEITDEDWGALDEAVFDLYDLDATDRIVVRDGLFRASWQWQAGRESSVANADIHFDITRYAMTFLSVITGWLSSRNKRRMRAEIFNLPQGDALRVVRFVLENRPGEATIEVVEPQGDLNEVLDRIGKRLRVKLATALSGERELRIHGHNEVIIIKPAARRYWMGICALEDADAVIAESFTGGNA